MVVVSFCGNVRQFDSSDIHDLRSAVARQFLLEGLTFDILCGDDNRCVQNEDIAANYDMRVKADDQALMQLERQSHDFHNMKWALVREHLANLRSDFMDLKKQNQLLDHRYHQVHEALEMERTMRNSMVQELKAKLLEDTREKADAIAKLEQETKNALNTCVHSIQEQIRASNSDVKCLRGIHEKDTAEIKQQMQVMAGEAARNFQSAQREIAKMTSKQEEHLFNLQKEDEKMYAMLGELQTDAALFKETTSSNVVRLHEDHDALRRAEFSHDAARQAATHEVEERVTQLEKQFAQADGHNQEDFGALRRNLKVCHDSYTALQRELTNVIEHTTENFQLEIKQLASDRKKIEDDIMEEFRPKILSSQVNIADIFRWMTSQTETNSLNKQNVGDIERRLVKCEDNTYQADKNLQALIEQHEEVNNERHADAQENIHHLAERLDGRLDAIESEYRSSSEKSTEGLTKLIENEQLTRETALVEQRSWMGDWRDDFLKTHNATTEEREKTVTKMIKETQETISAVSKTSQERADYFKTKLERTCEDLHSSLKLVENDMQAKMNALLQKFSEVSTTLSLATETRFNTLAEDMRRSSTTSEDAISQLMEVDSRLDSLMHDISKVKQHIPMLFMTV